MEDLFDQITQNSRKKVRKVRQAKKEPTLAGVALTEAMGGDYNESNWLGLDNHLASESGRGSFEDDFAFESGPLEEFDEPKKFDSEE